MYHLVERKNVDKRCKQLTIRFGTIGSVTPLTIPIGLDLLLLGMTGSASLACVKSLQQYNDSLLFIKFKQYQP